MRRVREMLKLRLDAGLSLQEVAFRSGLARSTLREMVGRFERSGLAWPLPLDLSDAELEVQLYGDAGSKRGHRRKPEPDWATVHRELKSNKHVTLETLWSEYTEAHPDGYRYSRFCELYASWEKRLPVTMRQTHLGGDKLFIDYAGDKVAVIVDRRTGRTQEAHIFVAVMGGSSLTFAHASWTETLPDWIDAHVRAFGYFQGAPSLLVPDNPKVAIIKACFYDPQVNRTYGEMAAHYGTALLPARPRRPRDKAKVESAVRIVERWLLGKLRRRRFYSLADVNAAIAELLDWLNDRRVLRYIQRTRRQLFKAIDAPLLKALPTESYAFAEWRVRKVGMDYHVVWTATFILSPIATPAPRSSCAPRCGPSKSSSRATASPSICAAPATASIPPSPTTCPPATVATRTGRSSGSCAKLPPSAPRLSCSAR
jgi:transposase